MSHRITETDHLAPTLFVSYRRTDAFAADQIVQSLQHALGQNRVIQDTLSFEPAENFPDEIARHIRDCRLMLVVIGPHWCSSGESNILLRDNDWVRREVELAVETARPMLPVLLAGAQMPEVNQLPESMHPLLGRNALQFRTGEDSAADLRKIVAAARRYVPRDWRRVTGEIAFMVAGMAAAAMGGAMLGSKTLFSGYAAWQWPNIVAGLSLAVMLPTSALVGHLNRLWSAKWRRPRSMYRQPILQNTCFAGVALAVTAFFWPVANPIDNLYASLQSTRSETPRVEALLNTVRLMPRFAGSEDVRLLEQVVAVRKPPTLNIDAAYNSVNAMAPYLHQPDTRRRLWALLTSAEAYRFVNRYDEQLAMYQQVAQDSAATTWMRWYAYQELGAIYYQHKNDARQARINWEAALKYRTTRGLLQNLAILDEDEGKWDSAAKRYEQAEQVLNDYKASKQVATLPDQEAALFANWCNMRRQQANRASGVDPVALRHEATRLCRTAVARYPPYLDAHWNLARVQLDSRDFIEADKSLRGALATLRDLAKADPESLNRYGYNVYGERYTLWLLVASRFLSGQPLGGDVALRDDFRRLIVQLQPSEVEAVAALLSEMAKRDLTVDEDRSWLTKMSTVNYLNLR